MDRSERDALVADARATPLAMVGHVGTRQALSCLAGVLARVAEALPVEEEKPQPTEACEEACEQAAALGEPCEHAEPDFAAMAEELCQLVTLSSWIPNAAPIAATWLRANAHRFTAPAPAVVRDEAWHKVLAVIQEHLGVHWAAVIQLELVGLLRSTFAAAPAFDVKVMADAITDKLYGHHRYDELHIQALSLRNVVLAVAREMGLGKGGA
jgi:hypothetical protein